MVAKMSPRHGYDPQLRLRALRHQGDGAFHRYGDLSDGGDGPYQSKPHDKYFYLAIVLFVVFLGFLPKILRKLGCAPPRPQRWWEVENNNDENAQQPYPELSEEERRELVENSLFTSSAVAHSRSVCGTCSAGNDEVSSANLDETISSKGSSTPAHAQDTLTSTSTCSTAQDSETSPNDPSGTLQPCHICLEKFQVDDTVAWSNVSKCRHTFHKACIEEWMMKHEDCPCCRAETLHLPRLDENATGSTDDVQVDINNGGASESAYENEGAVGGTGEADGGEQESKDSSEVTTISSINVGDKEDGGEQEEAFCFCVEHGLQPRSASILSVE